MTVLLLGDVGRQTGNLGDIETEGETGIVQVIERKPLRLEGVVARDEIPGNPVAEDRDQDVMPEKPAVFVAIERIDGREDAARLPTDPGFFKEFPDGGSFYRFAGFDLAARKTPSAGIRRVGPAHQKNPFFMEDGSNRGGDWESPGNVLWRCRHIVLSSEAGKGVRRLDPSLRRHDPDQVQRVTVLPFGQQYLSPLAGRPSVVRGVAEAIR